MLNDRLNPQSGCGCSRYQRRCPSSEHRRMMRQASGPSLSLRLTATAMALPTMSAIPMRDSG